MTDSTIQDMIDTANLLLGEAQVLCEKSDYDLSEQCVKQVLALFEAHAERDDLGEERTQNSQKYQVIETLAHAYNRLNVISLARSDLSLSLQHAQHALAFCRRNGNSRREAGLFCNIGEIYRELSDYVQALEYMQKGLAAYTELGIKDGIARNLNNIGRIYRQFSDYTKELEYYQKALVINQELGRKQGIAAGFINIGIVFWNLSDNSTALEYYQKALALNQELGHKDQIAVSLVNIGIVYHTLSEYDKALEYYEQALAINKEIGRKSGIALTLGSIGALYTDMANYDKALELYLKALAINEELGIKEGIAINLGSIGATYASSAFEGYDAGKAEEYLLKAFTLCSEIGAKLQLSESHKRLAAHYKYQERWKDFATHFEQYHDLNEEINTEEVKKKAIVMGQQRKIEESERDRQVKLARFQEQEKILHNILPSHIAERIIEGEKTIADTYENVSVFFSDIVGFTKLSEQVTAQELVGMLNEIFSQFDQIARKHGLEKIKTIGDAYMAVCGAHIPMGNHAERTALFALEVVALMKNYSIKSSRNVMIRIGLHSGNVVAGVIGEDKFAYDMWGDAVNTASRMESHGEPGKIHCTEEFMHALSQMSPKSPKFINRGEMHIKGKGKMKTYFLEKI